MADIRAAQAAWEEHDLAECKRWLARYEDPLDGASDLRGFEWFYLSDAIKQSAPEFTIHRNSNSAHSVSFSQTGIFAAAWGDFVELYDSKSRESIGSFTSKSGNLFNSLPEIEDSGSWAFNFAAISSDGKYLAYPHEADCEALEVRQLPDGPTYTIGGYRGAVRHAEFSQDARYLATASHDGEVTVVSVEEGKRLISRKLHTDLVWKLAFSPDGTTVASAGADGLVVVWNFEKDERQDLKGHFRRFTTTRGVNSVAFSSDGKRLVSGGADRLIIVWDLETGEQIAVLAGHTDEVRSVEFSHDGQSIVSGGRDGTVRLWNPDSGRCLATLSASSSVVHCVAFDPSDNARLVSADFEGNLCFWDLGTHRENAFSINGRTRGLAISPDAKLVAICANEQAAVWLWSENGPRDVRKLEFDFPVESIAISGEYKLAARLADGSVWLRDLRPMLNIEFSGIEHLDLSNTHNTGITIPLQPRRSGQPGVCNPMCFSEDGTVLAIAGNGGDIVILDITTLEPQTRRWEGANAISLDFDDGQLFFVTADSKLYQWDLSTDLPLVLRDLDRNGQLDIYSVNRALSVVDGRIACASSGIVIRDMSSGEEATIGYRVHSKTTLRILDANTLVSCGDEHVVRLWDIERKCERFSIRRHASAVYHLEVSDDGQTIVTAGMDGEVRISRAYRADQQ